MPRTAVLFSGGLDSAVLLARERAEGGDVHPIYVGAGLAWEAAERRAAARLLAGAPFAGRVAPLAALSLDMTDVYTTSHWAVAGTPPAYDTPDEDVYLLGRNLTLIAKAGTWCARHHIERLALGPLAGNPFPDATPAFFEAMGRAVALGVDRPFEVVAPLVHLHKDDLVRLGIDLAVPLERTLSCMNPAADAHCGVCSKCRERRDAFAAAGVPDRTAYAAASPRRPPA
jgi:7-cyano-7-deazaguanine synthase